MKLRMISASFSVNSIGGLSLQFLQFAPVRSDVARHRHRHVKLDALHRLPQPLPLHLASFLLRTEVDLIVDSDQHPAIFSYLVVADDGFLGHVGSRSLG